MARKNVNLVFPKILGFEHYINLNFRGSAEINHRVYALLCGLSSLRWLEAIANSIKLIKGSLQMFPQDRSEHLSYVVAAIFMKTVQGNKTTSYISTRPRN
jgi:hypothetical protein